MILSFKNEGVKFDSFLLQFRKHKSEKSILDPSSPRLARKPSKIFLKNTNLLVAVTGSLKMSGETGTIRETFFLNQLQKLAVFSTPSADFLVEDKYLFEIGGKSKKIPAEKKEVKNFYAAMDNIEVGAGNKIPLYLFGFLY